MAHKPKTYVPLGGNNVARRSSRNGIVIVDQTNNDCIELNQNEVAALRTLITSAITDEQIAGLLNELQNITNEFYCSANARRVIHHQVVRDWLAALNQQPATSH